MLRKGESQILDENFILAQMKQTDYNRYLLRQLTGLCGVILRVLASISISGRTLTALYERLLQIERKIIMIFARGQKYW